MVLLLCTPTRKAGICRGLKSLNLRPNTIPSKKIPIIEFHSLNHETMKHQLLSRITWPFLIMLCP